MLLAAKSKKPMGLRRQLSLILFGRLSVERVMISPSEELLSQTGTRDRSRRWES